MDLFQFMKFFLPLCFFPLVLVGQNSFEAPWTFTYGASSNLFLLNFSSINIRYGSPDFRWYREDLSESEEKQLDKYKNMRLQAELIYQPPLKVMCMGFYLHYRFLNYKKLSMSAYIGPKLFFVPGPVFSEIKYLKGGKEIWFVDMGLTCQLDFKTVIPFIDLGIDGIVTIGTACNFHSIYRTLKKRYHLRTRENG